MSPCEYCGVRPAFDFVTTEQCRCGGAHRACRKCWRKHSKITGEFPHQDYRLANCPPRKEQSR